MIHPLPLKMKGHRWVRVFVHKNSVFSCDAKGVSTISPKTPRRQSTVVRGVDLIQRNACKGATAEPKVVQSAPLPLSPRWAPYSARAVRRLYLILQRSPISKWNRKDGERALPGLGDARTSEEREILPDGGKCQKIAWRIPLETLYRLLKINTPDKSSRHRAMAQLREPVMGCLFRIDRARAMRWRPPPPWGPIMGGGGGQ